MSLIQLQLVHFPNSLGKTDTGVVKVKRIADAIKIDDTSDLERITFETLLMDADFNGNTLKICIPINYSSLPTKFTETPKTSKYFVKANRENIFSLENVTGLFRNQSIYLRDNFTGSLIDLQKNEYTFLSKSGVFENRFEIIYKNSETIINLDTAFFISSAENGFTIESNQQMSKIQIFDILGRNLFTKNINSTNEYIEFPKRGYVYIVIVDFQNGEKQNKKIIF